MGEKVREAIDERLNTIKNWAYAGMQDYDEQVAKAQVDDLVEYSWVALPFDGTNYAETHKSLKALMAARKNTRNFSKVTWNSNQPKSSIDGQLESVIPKDKYPDRNDLEGVRTEKVKFLYKNYGAGPAERLSGVDLLKRKGSFQSASGFPSTSHMAAITFLQRLFDGVKVHPNPYYAILHADGDRMGRVIDNQAEQGEKQHQALSKALNTFAGSVRGIVEEKYQGALVYAGGDDMLALMPLHTVLQCAKELADNFRQELNEFKDDNGNSPTLSAG